MEITSVRIFKLNQPDNALKAFATVTLDDELALTGIKVIDGKKGLFVGMPARANEEGEYFDIFYPVTAELREELTTAVLDAYDHELTSKKPKSKAKKTSKSRKHYEEDED